MRKLLITTLALGVALAVAPGGLLAHGGHSGAHAGWWGVFHPWTDGPMGVVLGLLALVGVGVWLQMRTRRQPRP